MLYNSNNCIISQRIVVMGDKSTGKSNIISRFHNNTFEKNYIRTIENKYNKIIKLNNRIYNLNIHDTAGTKKLNHLVKQTIYELSNKKFNSGFIIVCNINNDKSINNIEKYINLIQDTLKRKDNLNIIIVINKCDLIQDKKIFNDKIKFIKEKYNQYQCVSCSALNRESINNIFKKSIRITNKNEKKRNDSNIFKSIIKLF